MTTGGSPNPPVTQEDLVARLEVRGIRLDRTALVRIESRQRGITDLEMLAIASALRVPVERFFQKG